MDDNYAASTTATIYNSMGASLSDVCNAPNFVLFMSLLNAMVRNNEKISGISERVRAVKTVHKKYDFIVVGGGAAGSVLAARLSEIEHWKVLLLEAGLHEPPGTGIPGFASKYLGNPKAGITWNYRTTNERYACLSTNGSCAMTQGKNLGGNTAHNGMIYLRGNPSDYDDWAKLGNEGWTWKEVEPYFLKAEDNGEIERVGCAHHATGGPLSVERFPYVPPLGDCLLKASIEAGYGASEDLNGDTKCGFSIVQAMQKKGVRHSSARAYLYPVRNRRNLHVSLNSTVTKLIVEKDCVVGVEYYKNGERKVVFATKEVILAGGAVGSPHLLLLSGIGPKKHLESMGIKVVKNIGGVGKNFHDHPGAVIPFTINESDFYDNDWAVATKYLAYQSGPLSAIGTVQVVGLLASNGTTRCNPDIELYFLGYLNNCAPGKIGAFQSKGKRVVAALVSYLHPKSRGRITLASKDPFELPLIRANYLENSEDVDRMIEGVRMACALVETEALRSYNFTFLKDSFNVCSHLKFKSKKYWTCVLRQSNYALYHQAGTCKMGPSDDRMAVVDPRLRVHGMRRLRIADGSVMPKVVSSNTAAPCMMIGERAADFIKEDYGVGSLDRRIVK